MASGFLQYFFRWISGGAVRVLSGPYRCEFSAGVTVGPESVHADEMLQFAAASATGPEHAEGVPL